MAIRCSGTGRWRSDRWGLVWRRPPGRGITWIEPMRWWIGEGGEEGDDDDDVINRATVRPPRTVIRAGASYSYRRRTTSSAGFQLPS